MRPGRYMTPEALVDHWNGQISLKTLANWRSLKKGPRFVKIGKNKNAPVLYPVRAVEAYKRVVPFPQRKKRAKNNHHHRG